MAGSDAVLDRLLALHPRKIDLSLGRIERLLAALGNPETKLPPAIHIAGTNGKGSTLAYLRSSFEAADRRVHAYTSPHLVRFHERIRLAGSLITEAALAQTLNRCAAANAGQPITFFEITTAAAFLAMAETPADIALIEVGLGGRLDATNVLAGPALSLITPVDMDHQEFLGGTLAEIASEKAGILKPGVPAIAGPQHPEAMAVIAARAAEVGALLWRHGQDWSFVVTGKGLGIETPAGFIETPLPNLVGVHQPMNAALAAAGLHRLGLGETAIAHGVASADWPGRLQRLTGTLAQAHPNLEIWVDGGHNPAAGRALAETLRRMNEDDPKPLHLIVGMLTTKATDGFLEALAPLNPTVTAVPVPNTDAGRAPEEVAAMAERLGLAAKVAINARAALDTVTGRTVFSGSLYLAGAVLARDA